MIKSTMQVVLLVVLSFGVMAAGINPGIRTDIQATIRSTGAALSAFFLGNVNVREGTVNSSGQASVTTGILTKSSSTYDGLIYNGNQSITETLQTYTSVSGQRSKLQAATNAKANTGFTTGNISASANANVGSLLSLNAGVHSQLKVGVGVSK